MSDILGTYDLSKKVEDIVVLLENTRKCYGNPDVVIEIESGIDSMIRTKLTMEPKTRFALVTFSNRTKVNSDFEDFTPDAFQEALYGVELAPSDVANINVGLNAAVETLVRSMQQLVEGKQFRIIIISEGQFEGKGNKWEELTSMCSKVGIIIDTIQIVSAFGRKSDILESIAKRTMGYFTYVEEMSQIEATLTALAPNKALGGEDAFQSQEDKDMKGLLEIIAVPLITMQEKVVNIEDLQALLDDDDAKTKCGVCRAHDCALNGAPAFSCGCYCPECETFYHTFCVAGWAESQKDTPKTVFKCPVCFHLLKVTGTVHRIKVLKENLVENQRQPRTSQVRKFDINEIGQMGAIKWCGWCRNVFNPHEEVLNCPECGSFYHDDCMNSMVEKTHNRCRLCDAPFGKSLGGVQGIERIV